MDIKKLKQMAPSPKFKLYDSVNSYYGMRGENSTYVINAMEYVDETMTSGEPYWQYALIGVHGWSAEKQLKFPREEKYV